MWKDNLKKIRRLLRDPDGNIWTNGFLLRSFNDSQRDFTEATNLLEKIEAIRVPPQYGGSYMYDWEWTYCDDKQFQMLRYYDQSDIVLCYRWEAQNQGVNDGADSDEGYHYAHPFEAYLGVTCAELPPVWFPLDFDKTRFIAWDKEPIDFISVKEMQSDNASYRFETGKPKYYFRKDELSNEFYLYPKTSSPVWDDVDGEGQVLFDEDEDVNQEAGTIIDITELLSMGSSGGIVTDVVSADDNVLLIYNAKATNIESMDDETDYPKWIQKYIEYGAIERAYKANTDGKISSLADYWQWRKELGIEVIKKFKQRRRTDRDYRFTSKHGMARRNRRGPRLPDTYPAQIP